MVKPGLLDSLIGDLPALASLKDEDGRYVLVNRAWLTFFGKSEDEVLGQRDDQIFHARLATVLSDGDRWDLDAPLVQEVVVDTVPKSRVLSSTKYVVRAEDGARAVATLALDVTSRRDALAEVQASERRHRALVEHSPEASMIFDLTRAAFVDANDNAARLFGMSKEELRNATPAELSPPHQADGRTSEDAALDYIGQALRGETPVFNWIHRTQSGELVPCRIWLASIDLETGPAVRAHILDMREVEEIRFRLRTTRAQLDAVLDQLPQVVVVYEPESERMVLCNRTYQELRPKTPLWMTAEQACNQALERGTGRMEVPLLGRDGRTRLMNVDVSIFQSASGVAPLQLLLVGSDITKQKEVDARLQNARSLESLGRLAGGVAHDFNNLLTVILGSAEFIAPELQATPEALEDLGALRDAAKQAQDLTGHLLSFARSNPGREDAVVLDQHLAASMNVLQRLVGEDVDTVVQLKAPRQRILIDPGQLEQILVNLMVNSREAMQGGGRITLGTRQLDGDASYDLPPGRYVELAVSDAGAGMTPEVIERAFDPFFTTKPAGSGAGLGLSTVYGIVDRAGGQVRIESQAGVGTTVRVVLPVCGADTTEGRSTIPPAKESGAIEILLVEDDDGVRGVNCRALSRAGHAVTAAASGEEALELVRAGRRFDIVVTDIVMPKISGFELAEQLKRDFRDLPFVFVSGYAEEALRQRGLDHRQVDILQKPFAPDLLVAKVTEALRGERLAPVTGHRS